MPKISRYITKAGTPPESLIPIETANLDGKYVSRLWNLSQNAHRGKMRPQVCDFSGTANLPGVTVSPFTATAIGAGSVWIPSTNHSNHPGIISLICWGLNNGYSINNGGASAILIGGGEIAEAIWYVNPSGGRPITDSKINFGFLDLFNGGFPTDGALIQLSAGSITGYTVNNTVSSATGTSYACAVSTWYRTKIVVNSTATRVDFYVYSAAGAVLWTDYLTTNIPTAAGRETGFGITAYSNVAANHEVYMDYMAYYNNKELTR